MSASHHQKCQPHICISFQSHSKPAVPPHICFIFSILFQLQSKETREIKESCSTLWFPLPLNSYRLLTCELKSKSPTSSEDCTVFTICSRINCHNCLQADTEIFLLTDFLPFSSFCWNRSPQIIGDQCVSFWFCCLSCGTGSSTSVWLTPAILWTTCLYSFLPLVTQHAGYSKHSPPHIMASCTQTQKLILDI